MISLDAKSESKSLYFSELIKVPLLSIGRSLLLPVEITCLISRSYLEANSKSL